MEWNPFPMISLVLEIRRNASGAFSLIKFLSLTASIRLSAVKMIYLSSPENAPWARTMVALQVILDKVADRLGTCAHYVEILG